MANFANVTIFGLLLIILWIIVRILNLISSIKSQVATNNINLLNLINDIKGWVTSNNNQPHPPASDPITLPKSGADPFIESGEKTNIYEINGPAGVKLTLSNVHSTVKPYLLTFSRDEEDRLKDLPIDGYFVLGQILGNIVFYDKDAPYHLITHFLNEVTLTFTLPTSYRNQLIKDRDEKLIRYVNKQQGFSDEGKQALVKYIQDLDLYIPAYLYVSQTEKNIQIWKPFQYYSVMKILDNEKNETGELAVTIIFKSWGDQNVSIISPLQAGYGPK